MNYKGLLRKYLFHPAYVRIFVVVLLKLIKKPSCLSQDASNCLNH